MSSTAADVHPALPPVRTAAPASDPAPAPACSAAASSSSTAPAPDAESVATTLPAAAETQQEEKEVADSDEAQQEQETEPTTPTSEESKLRPPAECPPAPRKPTWAPPSTLAKRKSPSSAAPSARRTFFPVARDLTTVFRALPPKKRIRAG